MALGTRHDVNVSGTSGAVAKALGSVNLLPPTLTAQWNFMPDQTFDPYVGAGLAYVRDMDNGLMHTLQLLLTTQSALTETTLVLCCKLVLM